MTSTADLTQALNLVLEGIQKGLIEFTVRTRARREPPPKRYKHQIGDVFHGFTLVERLGGPFWMVECPDCAQHIIRRRGNVTVGLVRCDCQRPQKTTQPVRVARQTPGPKTIKPIKKGTRFGRLFVHDYLGVNAQGDQLYSLSCLCGGETIATRNDLVNGVTQSCGCQK